MTFVSLLVEIGVANAQNDKELPDMRENLGDFKDILRRGFKDHADIAVGLRNNSIHHGHVA